MIEAGVILGKVTDPEGVCGKIGRMIPEVYRLW